MATILEIKSQRLRDTEDYFGISYEFTDAQGAKWTNTTWVSDPMGAAVGSEVPVQYLPDRPEKNQLSWTSESDA